MKKSFFTCAVLLSSAILLNACTDDIQSGTACGETTCKAGQQCIENECVDTSDCTNDQIKCDDQCTDISKDANHCGECNKKCEEGQACVDSQCVAKPSDCPAEQTLCGESCFDLQNDNDHCGACGNACTDGKTCIAGTCAGKCAEGLSECDGKCIDTNTDPDNCGTCGTSCTTEAEYDENGNLINAGSTAVCVAGKCVVQCLETQTECDGQCYDLNADAKHCGACGNACPDEQTCENGKCSLYCPSGETVCNNACANLLADSTNCGSCGNACDAGFTCKQGQCEPNCPTGQTECDGQCYDLQASFDNCGKCGQKCQDGEVCSAGACNAQCAADLLACDGNCVDPQTDARYCGAKNTCKGEESGQKCADSQICVEGACTCPEGKNSCWTGETDASGANIMACAVSATDADLCGCDETSAGLKCSSLPNIKSGATCSEGQCVFECKQGYADCDGDASNGCEARLNYDVNNCGACGNACPADNTSEVACVIGNCTPTCNENYTECNGACLDLSSDANNCGACGNICPTGFGCVDSYCTLTECTLDNGNYAAITYNDKSIKAFCVKSAGEFQKVRDAVNEGKKYPDNNDDNAYVLLDNIDLGSQKWTPVGSSKAPFSGIFFGNGRKISGNLSCSANYCGIFGYLDKAYLDSFIINASISNAGNISYIGGLAGYATNANISNTTYAGDLTGYQYTGGILGFGKDTQIRSCRINSAVKTNYHYTGGIVGYAENASIYDCSANEARLSGLNYLGGIVGSAVNTEIDNCTFDRSEITASNDYVGGIVGHLNQSKLKNSKAAGTIDNTSASVALLGGVINNSDVDNCIVESGTIKAKSNDVGGIAGSASGSHFTNCITKAEISSAGQHVGGFLGHSLDSSTFSNCSSEKDVTAHSYVGGFVGYSASSKYENCASSSNVTATDSNKSVYGDVVYASFAGGFAGFVNASTFDQSNANGNVKAVGGHSGSHTGQVTSSNYTNCHATGKIDSDAGLVGGFVGLAMGTTNFTLCSALGDVSGKHYTGGFCGDALSGTFKFKQCAAYGNVIGENQTSPFLGQAWSGTITVDTCFATGNAQNGSTPYIGGLVGRSNSTLYISESYTTGTVTATNANHGSIIGAVLGGSTKATSTYYWAKTSDKISASSLASGSSYSSFTYPDDTPMIGGTLLAETLKSHQQNTWEERKCTIKSGPANGTETVYLLPVLMGMKPEFCK